MVGVEVSRKDASCWDIDVFEDSVSCVGECLIVAWFFVVDVKKVECFNAGGRDGYDLNVFVIAEVCPKVAVDVWVGLGDVGGCSRAVWWLG